MDRVWLTRTGKPIHLRNMSVAHLKAAINSMKEEKMKFLLEGQPEYIDSYCHSWIRSLQNEIDRRK